MVWHGWRGMKCGVVIRLVQPNTRHQTLIQIFPQLDPFQNPQTSNSPYDPVRIGPRARRRHELAPPAAPAVTWISHKRVASKIEYHNAPRIQICTCLVCLDLKYFFVSSLCSTLASESWPWSLPVTHEHSGRARVRPHPRQVREPAPPLTLRHRLYQELHLKSSDEEQWR